MRIRPWMLVSAAWIAPAILGCVNQLAQDLLSREPQVNVKAVLFAGGDWLLYAFLTPAVFAISARWPLSRSHLRSRAVASGDLADLLRGLGRRGNAAQVPVSRRQRARFIAAVRDAATMAR